MHRMDYGWGLNLCPPLKAPFGNGANTPLFLGSLLETLARFHMTSSDSMPLCSLREPLRGRIYTCLSRQRRDLPGWMLPANQFKRVHRSFIVSVDKIESYTAEAIEANGAYIPIGRGVPGCVGRLVSGGAKLHRKLCATTLQTYFLINVFPRIFGRFCCLIQQPDCPRTCTTCL